MIEYVVVGSVLGAGVLVLLPIAKVLATRFPYAYTNARIRAKLPGMITKEELEELAHRPYLDIVYWLEKKSDLKLSHYLEDDFAYAKLESALRTQLVVDLNKAKRYAPEPTKNFLKAIIKKYDIQLIETFVRSHKLSVPRELLHATELFSYDFIHKEHSLDALRSILQYTPYLKIFEKHEAEIRSGVFKAFELDLDLYYYKQLLRSAKTPESLGYVRRYIDAHNTSLVVQGQDPIIPGGRAVFGRPKEALIRAGYKITSDNPPIIEKQVYAALQDYAKRLLAKDPLSESSLIAFVIISSINYRNVAILLKLKSENFAPEKIVEMFI